MVAWVLELRQKTEFRTSNRGNSLCVRIAMGMKKRGGRKEIIASDGLRRFVSPDRTAYQEALVIALARGHTWNEMIQSGQYASVTELADSIGIERSYVARLLKFALLAPDIIEAILDGREPSRFSINRLIGAIPPDWEKQSLRYGFASVKARGA